MARSSSSYRWDTQVKSLEHLLAIDAHTQVLNGQHAQARTQHKESPQSNFGGFLQSDFVKILSLQMGYGKLSPAGGKGMIGASFLYFMPKARVSKTFGLKALVSATSSGVIM
jgi:hypothetical protein